MKHIFLFFLLISCGDSKLKIEEPKNPVTIGGETYSYVIVQLEFIDKIKELCSDLTLQSDFETEELYKQEIASCTFEKLSVLDLNALNTFQEQICSNPQTQQEIEACTILEGTGL